MYRTVSIDIHYLSFHWFNDREKNNFKFDFRDRKPLKVFQYHNKNKRKGVWFSKVIAGDKNLGLSIVCV